MKMCKIENCERKHRAKGYCTFHYDRLRLGTPLHQERQEQDGGQGCSIEGCARKHTAHGYCMLHYRRVREGTPLQQSLRKTDGEQGCLIKGCANKHSCKGYCEKHGQRVSKMRRKNKFIQQYGNKCYDCKHTFPSYVFDFDNISDLPGHLCISKLIAKRATDEVIQKELERCQLVCANCHRIRTFNRYPDTQEIQEYARESE